MSETRSRSRSLKARLLLTLLPPLICILVGLGFSGAWFARRVVEDASDRVLSGSLQAISETLEMQGGYLSFDLPSSALGMLENPDRDNVYYSISYRGRLITGYAELAAVGPRTLPLEAVELRDATFHAAPIRVAAEAKLIPQLGSPVIVLVAETMKNRTALVHRILMALVLSELLLLIAVVALVLVSVDFGLRPLSRLRREVEARTSGTELDFAPLPLARVPKEAVTFVEAFNALLDHVEASFRTLRRFTSDASHQLRVPLTVVRTHLELLDRHADGSAEMRAALDDMQSAVKALQRLIVQLIALAKAERPSDLTEDSGGFDLIDCTASVARIYAAQAVGRKMEISFESDRDQLIVEGSPIFAGEMIGNLLDNAVRYGNAGGQILVRIQGDRGLVEIEDDGPGVPPDQRERVFERFYRLPRSLDREGSGLGLPIVQALGRRMGATISLATPDSGRGLKAVLCFRLAAGPPARS